MVVYWLYYIQVLFNCSSLVHRWQEELDIIIWAFRFFLSLFICDLGNCEVVFVVTCPLYEDNTFVDSSSLELELLICRL